MFHILEYIMAFGKITFILDYVRCIILKQLKKYIRLSHEATNQSFVAFTLFDVNS